ncbi:MAG: hypothetical protein AB1505_18955 [Candidatus Latescibacterota bacterium]
MALVPAQADAPAVVETPPLRLPPGQLVVNADPCDGALVVEVRDAEGRPLPGFDGAACRLEPADGRRHTVRWAKGGLESVAPQVVRLRFVLQGARLFSFRVAG